jgi:hypothetical protein
LIENKRSRFQARRPVKSEYVEFFEEIKRARTRARARYPVPRFCFILEGR